MAYWPHHVRESRRNLAWTVARFTFAPTQITSSTPTVVTPLSAPNSFHITPAPDLIPYKLVINNAVLFNNTFNCALIGRTAHPLFCFERGQLHLLFIILRVDCRCAVVLLAQCGQLCNILRTTFCPRVDR